MNVEFCDRNVVVYAYDIAAGAKRERARQLLERLWIEGVGALSIQVLQELFVTLTRKIARPVDVPTARSFIADMATWRIVRPNEADVLSAIDATSRWRISFWDAMILTAAQSVGASVVWSDDLNPDQTFDGLTVRNPFAAS